MKKGPARFDYFLNKLQTLLDKATLQKNPALWLYKNDARTPLFMLEALAKLYAELHNKKLFTKLKEQFKLLEDTIGAIDYYDKMGKSLSTNKKIPSTIIRYLQAQAREKTQSLNEILVEKEWLSIDNKRTRKIVKKLKKADWLKEEKEVKAINEFYGAAIYEITEFVQKSNGAFDNVESGVHELRRKLRWLSIYPQALRGVIQLSENKTAAEHLNKYLTPEITGSLFNKMPDAGDAACFLIVEQNYFYSLSWMIDKLGKIKDAGLNVIAVEEAVEETLGLEDKARLKKTYQFLGSAQLPLELLLSDASAVCKTYFEEQNLENLVVGVKKVK